MVFSSMMSVVSVSGPLMSVFVCVFVCMVCFLMTFVFASMVNS